MARKRGPCGPAPADRGGSTEDAFIKISEALEDGDYKRTLKLVDGGAWLYLPLSCDAGVSQIFHAWHVQGINDEHFHHALR